MVVIVGQIGDDYLITINPETLAELQSVSAEKLSPVPINQFNLGLLEIEDDGEHYITNVGIVDYKVIHCNDEWWEFRHYFTNTHAAVRYIHEVQNLIDVLKDFEENFNTNKRTE